MSRDRECVGFWFILFCFIYFLCSTPSFAYSDYWPTKGWHISSPEEQGMNSNILADMIELIQKKGYGIDSVSIVRNGYLVVDTYWYPFSKDQKHNIHSCTKSVISTLIGIAIDKGYIKNVNQPIKEFFPDRNFSDLQDLKRFITLKNLLTMASGLKCRDSYRYKWAGLNEMKNSNDWTQYVLDLPMADPPGKKFEYCNGVSYLLSAIIEKTTRMKTLDFAHQNLFRPLGITEIKWETSPQGIDIGWGRMWLKPHDMAKIGWLFLCKGRWDSKQIVPSAWVEDSTRAHIKATLFDHYGYHWWVDSAGYYAAVGYRGQFIFVVPGKKIVATFTSDTSTGEPRNPIKLLNKYIIPAAVSTKPLPLEPAGKARLERIQNNVAKAFAFIWTSEKEGIAKDGVFRRTASPSFQFNYPLGSTKAKLGADFQIMRMKTSEEFPFGAIVTDIPEGIKLENFGLISYASWLNSIGGSNVRVILNKEIALNCGTKAYRTDFTWLWENGEPITTSLVSAYKDGKAIGLFVHTRKNLEEVEPIVQSLTFK